MSQAKLPELNPELPKKGKRDRPAIAFIKRFTADFFTLPLGEQEYVKKSLGGLFNAQIVQVVGDPQPKAKAPSSSKTQSKKKKPVVQQVTTSLNEKWHATAEYKTFQTLQKKVREYPRGKAPEDLLTEYKHAMQVCFQIKSDIAQREMSKGSKDPQEPATSTSTSSEESKENQNFF